MFLSAAIDIGIHISCTIHNRSVFPGSLIQHLQLLFQLCNRRICAIYSAPIFGIDALDGCLSVKPGLTDDLIELMNSNYTGQVGQRKWQFPSMTCGCFCYMLISFPTTTSHSVPLHSVSHKRNNFNLVTHR